MAGKGAGMSKGSGTRSGMLWQVERILEECKELNTLPQVLIMENVPQVHSKKNMPDFQLWLDKLKELGYSNYYQDLNAKDYGIPQNRKRTFMVSILGDYDYKFPQPIKLEKRLKDLLESSVDEKYYLSDAIVSKLAFNKDTSIEETMGVDLCDTKSSFREISNTIKSRYDCGYEHFSPGPTGIAEPQLDIVAKETNGNNFNTIYGQDGISPTLLARDYKDPVRVAEIEQVAQMYPNSGNPQAGRIYDKDGLSPCLDTCQGGNREVKIVEENCSKLQKEVCNKAVNYMQPGDSIDYTYSNSRLKEMEQGYIKTKNSEDNTIMNTLTTNADAFGVCVKDSSMYSETEKQLFTEDGNIKRYLNSDIIDKFEEGQMATTSYPNGYGHGSRTHNESISLNTIDKPSVKQNLRIRKLCPIECFRLMAIKDKDFENIAKNQSNASLYHLAGDSLVTTCLMAIFSQLLDIDWKEKINFNEWWNI